MLSPCQIANIFNLMVFPSRVLAIVLVRWWWWRRCPVSGVRFFDTIYLNNIVLYLYSKSLYYGLDSLEEVIQTFYRSSYIIKWILFRASGLCFFFCNKNDYCGLCLLNSFCFPFFICEYRKLNYWISPCWNEW